ncbi:MAG TPA: TPM domain-containing protein [Myxococcota bacterium]|nr:TPM domain-containing protein [Myxococcota bacterium]
MAGVEELLAPGAFDSIEAAVRDAERTTTGEIVPVVVERSDSYADVRIGAAALVAIAGGGLLAAFAPQLDPWLVPTQIGVFAALCAGFGWRPLLGAVAPNPLFSERVHQAAALAFHHAGLVETRERTGILIYVSLLERRVEVVADKGIHARVADGTWEEVVERVLAGIRAGRADQGLVAGIRRCGEILAANFPPRADDLNELPDRPRGA